MKIYNLQSIIEDGKYKDKSVEEVLQIDRSIIFNLIKKYKYRFDDEVLKLAHITKIEHEHTCYNEVVEHKKVEVKKLRKDTKSLEQILNEMEDERNHMPKYKEEKYVKEESADDSDIDALLINDLHSDKIKVSKDNDE